MREGVRDGREGAREGGREEMDMFLQLQSLEIKGDSSSEAIALVF